MGTLLHSILRVRRLVSVLVHAVLVALSNIAAFWLRFDGDVPHAYALIAIYYLPWLVGIRLVTFVPFRLFEGLWKYTSLWDLRNILLGVAVSSTVFYAFAATTTKETSYPRSVVMIDAILLVCLMAAIRLTRRIHSEMVRPHGSRRVLIYGAGDAGELIVRDMRQSSHYDAAPIGFVDDDRSKRGERIHGVPVLGGREQLEAILQAYRPDELLLAIPSATRESLRSIVRAVEPYHVRITTLPRLHELIGERVDVGQIRQLRVEDLLARDPVGLDYAPVREFLKGKRVMVTGAGGSIGSELCRQIATADPATLALVDRYENNLFKIHQELSQSHGTTALMPVVADITDALRLDQCFANIRPQVVFHAAAHKHVPLMEGNPCEAVKNNVRGTRLLAEAANSGDLERFILISTDKAVNPTSVMGSSKRVAELVVDSFNAVNPGRFATVRFGNVLGSNGSVVETFIAQIAKGGPVTITHPEMRRYFMLIPEAVQLVLHAAALKDNAPLFVLDMGEQLKVADLARDLIRLSGLVPDKDIELKFTDVRPGEKLREQLVSEAEEAQVTHLHKILRVQTTQHGLAGLTESVARLEALASEGRSEEVLAELRAITTALSSLNSKAPTHV